MGKWSQPTKKERDWFDKTSSSSTMRGGGPGPAVLVLMAHTVLALDFSNPSKCVSTIVSCCNPDQPPGEHPFRCFEVNECAGLYWEGTNACSDRTVARAIAALSPSGIETRVAHIDDNLVEIEIERRPIPRQREKLNEAKSKVPLKTFYLFFCFIFFRSKLSNVANKNKGRNQRMWA